MANRLIPALAMLAAALASSGALAQQVRSTSQPDYNLVQLSVSAAQIAPEEFQARTAAIRSCGDAVKLGEELGAKINRSNYMRAGELPPQLRPILSNLPTGEASPVLSEDGSVLHVLVICNR